MLATARLASLFVAAGGLVAGVYLMIAGTPDEDGFFTLRVLVAACGVGVLSLLMYILVLRPKAASKLGLE